MKGLLKNNLYAVCSSAKVFSGFMLLLGLFVTAVISQQLLIFYMLTGMIGFPIMAVSTMGKEYNSKWGRYKLTAPVKRADIVKSYFINFLLWLLVGVLFAAAVMSLSWMLHGYPFDKSADVLMVFLLGSSINLFTGAFFFPLFHMGGEERGGVFLAISLLCAIGIVMGIVSCINLILGPVISIWQTVTAMVVMLGCAMISFTLSYPVTVAVFQRKEY